MTVHPQRTAFVRRAIPFKELAYLDQKVYDSGLIIYAFAQMCRQLSNNVLGHVVSMLTQDFEDEKLAFVRFIERKDGARPQIVAALRALLETYKVVK